MVITKVNMKQGNITMFYWSTRALKIRVDQLQRNTLAVLA